MSSSPSSRPVFRLQLAYPDASYIRNDVPGVVRLARTDHPAFADDLERLADAIHMSNGSLTVILPEHEVFRDRLPLMARTPWTRRRAARRIAARALVTDLGDVALVMGRRGSDGQTPLAAVRRETLKEVREMLAGAGLRADAIRGAGRFEGFPGPPALGNRRPRPALWWPSGGLPHIALAPAGRLPRVAAAVGALAAAVALGIALLAGSTPPPVTSPGPLVHQSVARERTEVAELKPAPATMTEAPVLTTALVLTEASSVPEPVVPPAGLTSRPDLRQVAPPATRTAAAVPPAVLRTAEVPPTEAPKVAANARGTPIEMGEVLRDLPEEPSVGQRDVSGSALAEGPSPRPRPARVAPSGAAEGPIVLAAALPASHTRPLPRPARRAEPLAEAVKRVAVADTEDFVRPEHRPDEAPPVKVASLAPAEAMIGTLAAAVAATPLARPDEAARSPRTTPASAAAARPIAVAAAAPKPKIVPATPTPKITREARAAAERTRAAASAIPRAGTSRAGLTREALLLIGVFGDTDRPHALVRLPSGDIERVRTGDSIAGYRVASVSSDGVRMRSGATEAVLRMPD